MSQSVLRPMLFAVVIIGVCCESAIKLTAQQLGQQPDVASAGRDASRDASRGFTEAVFAKPVTINVRNATIEQALKAISHNTAVRFQYRGEQLDRESKLVTLHVAQLPLRTVLGQILIGTNLTAVALGADLIVLKSVEATHRQDGSIIGQVTDARTQRPMQGVSIVLDNDVQVVRTNGQGRFQFDHVVAGRRTITVRFVGFARQTRTVIVSDAQSMVTNFVLEPTTNTLDAVVVTGTVVPTTLKSIPNAITIVSGEELERRGVTQIDQLFHGAIPGLYAPHQSSAETQPGFVRMTSRGSTKLVNGGFALESIKVYVDGVELANPQYLGLIDPKSIERIEVLTGPQASTIYGSGAINGVMQVFTKRGTSHRPLVVVSLQGGFVQNNLTPALTTTHDYSARISGLEGAVSYSAGGSWTHVGPWTPTIHTSTASGFGDVKFDQKEVSVDVNGRRVVATNCHHM